MTPVGNIEDHYDLEADTRRAATATYVRPAGWKPQAEELEARAVPMPAWARELARTGRLRPEDERTTEPGETAEDAAERDHSARYAAVWRSCVREMTRLKADAARLVLVHGAETPIGREARQRGFDVDEEWARLRKLRDVRGPLHLRSFTLLDGSSSAGASVAQAERQAARSPLFDTRRAASGDVFVDPLEGLM